MRWLKGGFMILRWALACLGVREGCSHDAISETLFHPHGTAAATATNTVINWRILSCLSLERRSS